MTTEKLIPFTKKFHIGSNSTWCEGVKEFRRTSDSRTIVLLAICFYLPVLLSKIICFSKIIGKVLEPISGSIGGNKIYY